MALARATIDSGPISNLIARDAKRTFYVCGRCIYYFSKGEFFFMGKAGCCFVPLTDANREIYAAWQLAVSDDESDGFMKCFRCWIIGQECIAVRIQAIMV